MGGKTSTTTQGVSVPQEVLDRYKSINTRAENVAGTPFQTYSEDPSKFVAQITPQQSMGISNVNAAAGSYVPYFEKAYGSAAAGMSSAQPGALNLGQFYNPYQQQVIDTTMAQMRQANEQAQSGAVGNAIQSGAFGGDRAGIAAANLANQQGLSMGSTLAGLNAQNYNQALAAAQQQQGVNLGATQADLARLMQGGQFYAGLGQAAQQAGLQGAEAQINAGTLGQQTEQAGLSALFNQFQQKNAYPFQVAQFLANIGMGTGALSGSTTTTTQPGSYFSDRRLKEDVERIGEGDNGLPIYKYRYKGEPDTHIGFMADEVEKVRPEAVGLHPTGYKTVDYDRATKASGGVAGPYGSTAGSQPSGVAGYVPEAYLPVGELLMADPSTLDHARQSFAQQLQAAANFGNSVKDLDANWEWAKNKWGGDEREQAVKEGEQARGVAGAAYGGAVGYASGGPAYLNAGLRPGDTPNDRRTYLSDTLEAQSDQDKRRDGLAGPGSAPQARTTGQDMADIAKVALAFMGMNRGGRTGYATRGGVDYRTSGEAISDAFAPLRNFATSRVPNTVLSLGSLGTAGAQGLAGAGIGALGFPETSQYMLDAAKNSVYRGMAYDRAANAPMPKDLSFGEIASLGQTPEQRAEIARRSTMTMVPLRYVGESKDPILPEPPAGLRDYTEYGRMLRDPSTAMAPIAFPSPSGGGGDRAPTSVELQARRRSDAALRQRLLGNEPPLSMYKKYVSPDDAPIPMPSGRFAEVQSGLKLLGNEPPLSMYQEGMPQRPLSDSLGLGGGGADRMPSPLTYSLKPVAMVSSGVPLSYSPPAPRGPATLSYGLRPADTGASGELLSYSPTGVSPMATVSSANATTAPALAGAASAAEVPPAPGGGVAGAGMVTAPTNVPQTPVNPNSSPFGAALAFTLKHEGGLNPRDTNGYATNQGINQKWHPEIDVTKMTDAQRDEIYIRDYWRPINGDQIAQQYGQEMATAAFDTAVIAGVEKSKELLARSGGDVNTFLQLRADFLNGLVQDNPEKYGPYVKAWNNRNLALGGSGLMTGFGEAGIGAPAERRNGLAAGLGNDKPYDERNTLGQIMYDPETNKLSRNALLSLASGVGAMLSSPSQYFLPSLGLGLQGAAGTYAGLEKQAADVGFLKAQENQSRMEADARRFITTAGGQDVVNLGNGQFVLAVDYVADPTAYTTGNPELDKRISDAVKFTESQRSANTPEGSDTGNIFQSPMMRGLFSDEFQSVRMNPADARERSAKIEEAAGMSANSARVSIPNTLLQANAVANLVSDDAAISAGALGGIKQAIGSYLNDTAQTLNQVFGTDIPNWDGSVANAELILKTAVQNGMATATGIQELQVALSAQPGTQLSQDANSALMASILLDQHRAMRFENFLRDYKVEGYQNGNRLQTVTGASNAFQQLYGAQMLAEKDALKAIIRHGSEATPEWQASGLGYATPMELLMDPGVDPNVKNDVILGLLQDSKMGVSPMTINALTGPDGVMYIGNYFGG